jgi:uncharacterized protein (DUF58 family)
MDARFRREMKSLIGSLSQRVWKIVKPNGREAYHLSDRGPLAGSGHAAVDGNSAGARSQQFFDADFLKRVERLRLIAKRLSWAGAKGEHTAARKGFSLEFADYRNYQKGDDLRYVDWNIYRRLERLLVKVFTAEEEMNIYLLVDTSLSMAEGRPTKIEYAKKVAAAMGYIGLKNLDRVGGASFSSVLHAPLTLGRGRKQILRLFSFLASLSCSGATDLRSAIHSFTRLFPHAGMVIIVSDLFDPVGWRAALEELAAKKHQVLIFHLVDVAEQQPAWTGDVTLRDVEGGRERRFFLDAELLPLSTRAGKLFHGDRERMQRPAHRLFAHDHTGSL